MCVSASKSEPYALEMVRLCLECVPAALFARGRTGKEKGHLGPLPAFFLPLPTLASLLLLTDARVDSRSVQLLRATADSRPRLFPPQVGRRRARQRASAGRQLRFSRAL